MERKEIEQMFSDLLDSVFTELNETKERAKIAEAQRDELRKVLVPFSQSGELNVRTRTEKQKEDIKNALLACHGIQTHAAKLLGISPRMVNYFVKRYGLRNGNGSYSKGTSDAC